MNTAARLDHLQRQRDHTQATLNKLTDPTLHELLRRLEQPATNDGYPNRTLNLDPPGGTSNDTSVERNALNGLPDNNEPDDWTQHNHAHDHTAEAIQNVQQALQTLDRAAKTIDRNLGMIQHGHEKTPNPDQQTSPDGHCQACTRWVSGTPIDRLRSAYCGACYAAWQRRGQPDRQLFEIDRRRHTQTDTDPVTTMVVDQVRAARSKITGGYRGGQEWQTDPHQVETPKPQVKHSA